MEIFSYFRGLLSREKAAPPLTRFDGDWTTMGGETVSSVNNRNLLANNEEWVAIAADKVANSVASIRFKVMRYSTTDDEQEVFDGPLVEFLEQPALNLTGKDFIYLSTVYKELTGNAFWRKGKNNKLEVLVPTNVSPEINPAGKLTGYRYSMGTVQEVLSPDKVLHDRYVDPSRPYWGKGKLAKVARWVDISSFSNEFLRRFFINGATFGGFIETEEESQERINLIKAGLQNDHVGVANSHKTGVLPKGAKYQKVTANMAEIEMGATDDRYRDKILAAFGVPKNILGMTQGENRATVEGTEYAFLKHTIKPIADDLVEFLNVHIAPLYDPTGRTYFAYEDFIPKNMDHELKEREIALNRQPYMTVNEVRASQGLPSVKGGDVVYGSPLLVPLGTPPEALEDDEDDDKGNEPPKAAKARQRAVPPHVRQAAVKDAKLTRTVDGIADKLSELLTRDATYQDRDAKDAAAHKDFTGRVGAFTKRMEQAIKDFNSRQQSQVLLDLTSITKAVAQGDLWDTTQEVQLMVDVVTPILAGLLTEQILAEWEAQGFAGVFPSGSDLIKNVTERVARRLGKTYNKTTAKLIAATLNEGINAGDSMAQLRTRVQEVYAYGNMVRAKMVAHTETFYVANKANDIAYRASGVVKTKRWYTAEDERVCPFCGPMHGRIVDVSEAFFKKGDTYSVVDGAGKTDTMKLNYRRMEVPPLHPDCRCFIRPEEISIAD
jgi:HK97 family phage portal protein